MAAGTSENRNVIPIMTLFYYGVLFFDICLLHATVYLLCFSYHTEVSQLFQPPKRSLVGYKHVVDVEYCAPISSEGPHFPPEAAKAKEAAQNEPSVQNTLEYHEIMEGIVVIHDDGFSDSTLQHCFIIQNHKHHI